MGIKERRDRERQELRQGILEAARVIAAQEGWQAVTVRKVADAIEYSPPTIYEYFASKDAILQDLALEGFGKLWERIRVAAAAEGDPAARLGDIAIAHCTFAWDYPELYQVMNNLGGTACHLAPPPAEIMSIRETIRGVMVAALGRPDDPRPLFDELDQFRATLHGLISMTMADQLFGGRDRATHLAAQATRDMLSAWRAALTR